jgi:hypothetical protein
MSGKTLRETVAMALCSYCSGPDVTDPCPSWDKISEIERNEWRGEADAAIRLIAEECAKECERPVEHTIDGGRMLYGATATDCATRIRSLADKEMGE